jgi:hypothetical protein
MTFRDEHPLILDIKAIYHFFGDNEFTFAQIRKIVGVDIKTLLTKNIVIKTKRGKSAYYIAYHYRLHPKYVRLLKAGQKIPRPQSVGSG